MQHSASTVLQAARDRLQTSLHAAFRQVACEYDEGVLILRGQVSSYYLKQLAQEAVARLEGVARVVNAIEVVK